VPPQAPICTNEPGPAPAAGCTNEPERPRPLNRRRLLVLGRTSSAHAGFA
jgi:hypothetical protein